MNITEELFKLQDKDYSAFHCNLVPGISKQTIIGVRVPEIRKLAKKIYKSGEYEAFLKDLPHKYYDENMLHGLIISEEKDYDLCIKYIEEFLPYVDNWAVCDGLNPKVFLKNRNKLIKNVAKWIKSKKVYTCRFGVDMLMGHFLDDDFKSEYLEMPAKVKSEEYYVNMVLAWFYATALAKQWDATIPYITEYRFEKWVHNKTIQKARESYRITKEQKEYLNGYKIK